MRNGNCSRLDNYKYSLRSQRTIPSRFTAIYCALLSVWLTATGCQRFDRYFLDEKASLSFEDIPVAEEPLSKTQVPQSSPRLSIADSKRTRLGHALKKNTGIGVRIRDDQPPLASSIVETKYPNENLAEEIQSLSPEFKKLLQEYLASSEQSKTKQALASSKQPAAGPQPGSDIDLANHPVPETVERRSLKDESPAEQPAVVTASAQVPVSSTEGASPDSEDASKDAVNWNESLSKAITVLEKQIRENPHAPDDVKISNESKLRMLQLAAGKLEACTQPIDGLSAREQEYMRHQFQALHDATNPGSIPVRSKLWSTVMQSQREATNQLAAISDLEVRSVAFCTSVEGYGTTKKFANYQFKPDQGVLLYCELENVDAESVQDGFETQLQGRYEIIDNGGKRIADQLLPMEKEVCKNHRRDYFIVYRIYMPMQIPPGSYQLRLTIEDMKAKKYGQSMLDFQIAK